MVEMKTNLSFCMFLSVLWNYGATGGRVTGSGHEVKFYKQNFFPYKNNV